MDFNCAGIVVFSKALDKIVLVKTHAGHYSFPKGKREKGESVVLCAFRETLEETGISADNLRILKDQLIKEFKNNLEKPSIVYLVGAVTTEYNDFKFDTEELSATAWYTIEEALQLDNLLDRRKDVLRQALELITTSTSFTNGNDFLDKQVIKLRPNELRKISKTLSWILRHGLNELAIPYDSAGYARLSDVLNQRGLNKVTLEHIEQVVNDNDKKRFDLKLVDGQYYIRANQGHSSAVAANMDPEIIYTLLTPETAPETVVHGTTLDAYNLIKNEGLKPMSRSHVHFAIGLPSDSGVISGMRQSSEVLIFIDVQKALQDGIKFYISKNKVVLCNGLQPKYFKKVQFK